jgi:hypothetical protein
MRELRYVGCPANADAGRVAQLIQEAERRGKPEMEERARMKAETTPVAKAE